MLAAARAEGVIITVETTPHHLTCAAEEIDDDSTVYASVPPIRDSANRDALWDGLVTGTIDMVCSDHFPVPPAARTSRFDTTMPGIAALELRLPLVWTEAARRGIGINQLVQWLCRAPALLGRIHSGRIEPGMRADLVAWDPDAEFVVDPASLHQRHTHTPFTGRLLRGVVDRTWSAGRLVYAGGSLVGQPGGQILEQL
jgi:allantoinase